MTLLANVSGLTFCDAGRLLEAQQSTDLTDSLEEKSHGFKKLIINISMQFLFVVVCVCVNVCVCVCVCVCV